MFETGVKGSLHSVLRIICNDIYKINTFENIIRRIN
jgi:hypothetical protein